MRISNFRIGWFAFSFVVASLVAYHAFFQPEKYAALTDLLATILSILVGVSLAISALIVPPSMQTLRLSHEEKGRLQTVIQNDDNALLSGQNFIFWCYYISLLLAIALKFSSSFLTPDDTPSVAHCVLAAAFSWIAAFSLLWSAILPSLLRAIKQQRQELSGLLRGNYRAIPKCNTASPIIFYET